MSKIVLSKEEIALIEKHLDGKYYPFTATNEEQVMFNDLLNRAEELQFELDAIDERMEEEDGDLLRWYLKKYREQE